MWFAKAPLALLGGIVTYGRRVLPKTTGIWGGKTILGCNSAPVMLTRLQNEAQF